MDYYSPQARKSAQAHADDGSAWKGAAAGLAAGLLGAWTMNRFQSLWSSAAKSISERKQSHNGNSRERTNSTDAGKPRKSTEGRAANFSESRTSSKRGDNGGNSRGHDSDDDATMKTANRLARAFIGHELSHDQKKKAGTLVHYGYGALIGALYGLAAERNRGITRLAGLPFGAALFVGGDEIAVPALNLSANPLEYPLSSHLYGLASHFVYGATAELSRRLLRRL